MVVVKVRVPLMAGLSFLEEYLGDNYGVSKAMTL